MTMALLYGASSGALHAVTGPDHLLALGPVVLKRPSRSFAVGLNWGIGHSLGTVLLVLPLLLASRFVQLPTLAGYSERLAGLALLLLASWSLWNARRRHSTEADTRNPLLVGSIHGATGAGGLLMVLPMMLTARPALAIAFLLAFSVGSSVAMACLTACLGKLGSKLSAKLLSKAQVWLAACAICVGTAWLLGF